MVYTGVSRNKVINLLEDNDRKVTMNIQLEVYYRDFKSRNYAVRCDGFL